MSKIQQKAKKTTDFIREDTIKNPYILSAKKICQKKEFITELKYKILPVINIVSISIKKPDVSDFIPHDNGLKFPHQNIVYTYSKKYSQFILSEFKASLLKAVKDMKANIICVNELGMPLNKQGKMSTTAINFAKKIANDYKCLIFAGSIHTKESYLNQGFIFYPSIDQVSQEPYLTYFKNISAVQVEEKLYTPADRKIFMTKAFGVGISTLICLELVDYSSAVTVATSDFDVDILLVPTFLDTYGVMEKVAKNLSYPVGAVILTNYYDGNKIEPSKMYLNGEQNDVVVTKYTSTKKTKLILRKINVKDLHKEKTMAKLHPSPELHTLYGMKITAR
jgi:hypothetical protein